MSIPADKLLDTLKNQGKDKRLLNGFCVSCGETNPCALRKVYQNHHIDSRAFSDDQVLQCLNCHAVETSEQNNALPEHRDKQLPIEDRLAYVLLSHYAMFKRCAEVGTRLIHEYMRRKK